MAGANYMGGRRNAMKARAKDLVGQQQRGHFGRQKLNIIARGLASTNIPEMPLNCGRTKLGVEINLAHARQKLPLNEAEADSSRSIMPGPFQVMHSTPKTKPRRLEPHTSSSGSTRSKVLENLDLSEPIFFRRILDQIAAMPDLAGLTSRKSPKTKICSEDGDSDISIAECSNHGGTDQILLEDIEGDPRRKLSLQEEFHTHSTPGSMKSLRSACSSSSVKRFTHSTLSSSSSYERRARASYYTEKADDFEGASEDSVRKEEHMMEPSSSFWSSAWPQQSSKTSLQSNIFPGEENMSTGSVFSANSLSQSEFEPLIDVSSDICMEKLTEDEVDELPFVIDLEKCREGVTVYGSLFQQKDPWNAIGAILGLEPQDSSSTDMTGSEIDDLDDTLGPVRQAYLPNVQYLVHPDIEMNNDLPFGGVPKETEERDQKLQDDFCVTPENRFWEERDDDDMVEDFPGDQTFDPDNFELEVACAEKDVHDDSGATSSPGKVSKGGVLACGIELDVNVIGIRQGDEMIATPELREVDGRYLGPSLFDTFDSERESVE